MIPPPHLMVRVSRNDDPQTWIDTGKRLAVKMMDTAGGWSQRPVRDILDWGCGPGRVSSQITENYPPGITVYGCDVDAEAIGWAAEHVTGQYAVSSLSPPLPYEDQSFDAVLAASVFTHLPRRMQRVWLRELARVLRPGGVLVASVHGQAAAESFGVTDLAGIQDHYLDESLNGIAPDGYYRAVLQTEQYTRSAWSDRFVIVAYEEAALDLHDMVVLRPRCATPEPAKR
jgi:SAM-dependent methyltransferase